MEALGKQISCGGKHHAKEHAGTMIDGQWYWERKGEHVIGRLMQPKH
jgi:hypothetical protein